MTRGSRSPVSRISLGYGSVECLSQGNLILGSVLISNLDWLPCAIVLRQDVLEVAARAVLKEALIQSRKAKSSFRTIGRCSQDSPEPIKRNSLSDANGDLDLG
jgi:hypothetical protein